MNEESILDILLATDKISSKDVQAARSSAIEDVLMKNNITIPKISQRIKGGVTQYYTTVPAKYSKTGKRHQIVFHTQQEVLDSYSQEVYNTLLQIADENFKKSLTVTDLVKLYLKSRKPKKGQAKGFLKLTTLSKYQRMFNNHIAVSDFGKIKIANVKRYHCEDFLIFLYNQNLGISTVSQIISIVKKAFDYGVLRDLCDKNYMVDLKINESLCTPTKSRIITVWENEEIQKLAQTSLECWKKRQFRHSAILLAMIGLGCRIGEISALTWADIDFQNGTVSFSKTTIEYTDYEKGCKVRTVDTPKQPSSNRIVYMTDMAIFWLKEIKQRNEALGIISDAVVVTRNAKTPKQAQLETSFKKFCFLAGVEYKPTHTCRRTYATLLIDGNVAVSQVSKDLGHKKVSTTLNDYYKAKKPTAELLDQKNSIFNFAAGIDWKNLATAGNTPN